MSNTNDMTVGSPTRDILRFALPLILGYILQQLYLIADAAIVGRWIGVQALAAVGASSSVMFLVMGFCNGSCAGYAIPIAQAFGAKDYTKMRAYVANALRIAAVQSVVITLLTCALCSRILALVNTPADIMTDAWIFLFLQFVAIPFTMAYNLQAGFIRALGNSRQPFFFLIFSSLLNILLDVALILGLGLGVRSAIRIMLGYFVLTVLVIYPFADEMMMLFVDGGEQTVIDNAALFMRVANYFYPALGLLTILRYSIQGLGYSNLSMLSGVMEMLARSGVSLRLVPALAFTGVCLGDPVAWVAADAFLMPAFWLLYRHLSRRQEAATVAQP